jgi:3-hydroxyisobutyrate dehydrogenase
VSGMDVTASVAAPNRVGIVGLGRMGAPIARVLRGAYPLAVHDVDDERTRAVLDGTVRHCGSVAELAAVCDVVVTVLPGPRELAEVAAEALPVLAPGALWVDLTSGAPDTTRELAAAAARRGIDVVSAPMGGSVAEATAAALVFFVSGDDDAVDRAVPVLEHLAADDGIRLAGQRAEDGQVVKLLANALWFANAVAASEAMLVGSALGLPPEHLLHLLRGSAGASRFLDAHADRLLDGDLLRSFGIDRVVEELDAVAAMRLAAGVPTPVLDASAELHRAAERHFGPALGELLGVHLLEERAQRVLRRTSTQTGS